MTPVSLSPSCERIRIISCPAVMAKVLVLAYCNVSVQVPIHSLPYILRKRPPFVFVFILRFLEINQLYPLIEKHI